MRFYRSTDTNHQSRNIGSVFLVMCNLMDGLVPVSSLLLVRLLSSSATGSPCVPSVVTDVRWWRGCSVAAIPGSSCEWFSTARVCLWRSPSCYCVSPRCPCLLRIAHCRNKLEHNLNFSPCYRIDVIPGFANHASPTLPSGPSQVPALDLQSSGFRGAYAP